MVKLADTPDLGSGAARCAGSSPVRRTTMKKPVMITGFVYLLIIELENAHEGLLRNLNGSYLPHSLLTFLLLFEELLLT